VTAPEETEFDFSDDAQLVAVTIAFGSMSIATAVGTDPRVAMLAPLTLLLLLIVAGVNNAIAKRRRTDVELQEGAP